MKKTPAQVKREIAERMADALSNHPDVEARRWRFRELTREVGRLSGVAMSEDTGRTWMEGSQPRDPRVAAALAEALGVTAGWLYFGELPRLAPRVPESVAAAFKSEEDVDAERAAASGKSRRKRA